MESRKVIGYVAKCSCNKLVEQFVLDKIYIRNWMTFIQSWFVKKYTIIPLFDPKWEVTIEKCVCSAGSETHECADVLLKKDEANHG
jgi:hypothetical protein